MKEINKNLKFFLESIIVFILLFLIPYLSNKFYIYKKLDNIYIFLFIITIIKFFTDDLIEKIKLKKLEKKEIIEKIDIEYYRNILKENSPAVLSIIHDRKLDVKKDLLACIFYLEKEGYLKIGNKIEYTNKDYSSLPRSLEYIIENRDYLFTNTHSYIEELKHKKNILSKEYLNNGREKYLIKNIPIKIKTKNNEIVEANELYYKETIDNTTVYLVFTDVNGTYQFIDAYTDWQKVNKYSNNFNQLWAIRCYKELEEKKYYKERMKFHFSIITQLLIIMTIILPFFSTKEKCLIYVTYSIILFILIILSKLKSEENNKYVMTQKGYKMHIKIKGLEKYMSDFSILDERSIEELKLWDDYMIYQIIVNEDNQLINSAKDKINNLYNNKKK